MAVNPLQNDAHVLLDIRFSISEIVRGRKHRGDVDWSGSYQPT